MEKPALLQSKHNAGLLGLAGATMAARSPRLSYLQATSNSFEVSPCLRCPTGQFVFFSVTGDELIRELTDKFIASFEVVLSFLG